MYRLGRRIHEEDIYLLDEHEYESLPDGTVLYDYDAEVTFVKGNRSNYSTIRVFGHGDGSRKILCVGWTPSMAASQGLDQEFFMFALTS